MENYEILETLGTGAFSEVKKAIVKATGEQVAVKIIDKTKCVGKTGMIDSEVSILKKVKHPNIIGLLDLFESESKLFLVMELYESANIRVTGGELYDDIISRGHYSEKDASMLTRTILEAVQYLHNIGIAHRDLKPENLMFSSKLPDRKLMLGDFGLSKIFDDDAIMKTACGTPNYVAPEVLKRQGYGSAVDLWSIGVICYILICGYPPFYDESNAALFASIMKGNFEFDSPSWDNVSKEAKDFISNLLIVDPKKRMNVQEALAHPFINCNSPSSSLGSVNTSTFTISEKKATVIDLGTTATPEVIVEPMKQVKLEEPSLQSIKVLSLNIFMRPPLIKSGHSDFKDFRLGYFCDNFMSNFDIIALQEMFSYGSSRQKRIIASAEKAGFNYQVCSPSGGLFHGNIDGGLVILSKFPIISEAKMQYERGIGSDMLAAKGALYAKIQISPTSFLNLVTTHLQSTPMSSKGEQFAQKRERQLYQLKQFIDFQLMRNDSIEQPLLLTGDFNIDSIGSLDEHAKMMRILEGEGQMEVSPSVEDLRIRNAISIAPLNKLKLQDILYEKYREHPVTFGHSIKGAVEEVEETQAASVKESLDYLLWNPGSKNTLQCNVESTAVLPFSIPNNKDCLFVSDHFGISTQLSTMKK